MSFWKASLAAAVALSVIVATGAADPPPVETPEAAGAVADTDVPGVAEETSGVQNSSAPAEASAGEGDEEPAAEERKICKTVAPIGTRFGKKYCMTKKEWDAMRRRSQDDVSDAQRRGSEYRTKD